jgi:hypothetical protein
MSEKTYKLTELGERRPKRSELLAIAEACGVPMWFLEGGWDGWVQLAPTAAAADSDEADAAAAAEAARRAGEATALGDQRSPGRQSAKETKRRAG